MVLAVKELNVLWVDYGNFKMEMDQFDCFLSQLVPPEVNVTLEFMTVNPGDSTAFSYSVTDGDPPGFSLSLWKGNEQSSKPFNDTYIIFSNVTESDDGTYTFRAEGTAGIGTDSFTLEVGKFRMS